MKLDMSDYEKLGELILLAPAVKLSTLSKTALPAFFADINVRIICI